jgi:hypothetical protein
MGPLIILAEEEGPVIEEGAAAAAEAIAAETQVLTQEARVAGQTIVTEAQTLAGEVEAEGKAIFNKIGDALSSGDVGEIAVQCELESPPATTATVLPNQQEFAAIREHLAQFGPHEPNDAMLERVEQALAKGEPLTGADAAFYHHELLESSLMNDGLPYEAAHNIALENLGHSPFEVYHPDVVENNPDFFNDNWRQFWGIE